MTSKQTSPKYLAFFEKLKPLLWSRILLVIGATISILWSIYFSVTTIFIPYQIEFREGTALVLTKILLGRGNPFSLENQPLGMTNYGLGYNLAVLPFALILGNTLAVHRAVTFVFILLTGLLIFLSLYKFSREPALALACSAFVITGLIANGGIGAFPSAMGTFLFYLAILVPFTRSFDKAGLLVSVLASLASFYTKPYFILGFGIVASYLFLFLSKRKALQYITQFLFLFAISFLIVYFEFPFYFVDTIVGNFSNTYRTLEHLIEQLVLLLQYFYPVLILALVVFFGGWLSRRKNNSLYQNTKNLLNFADWGQPLIVNPVEYVSYSLLCSFSVFLLILGPHVGTDMYYAYQLVVPLFIYWLFQSIDFKRKWISFFLVVIVFNLFVFDYKTISPDLLRRENPKKWEKLIKVVASSTKILNSPVVTANVVELGLSPVDSGQTIYYYAVQPYKGNALIGPTFTAFQHNGQDYVESIEESIMRQEFDLIMTTDGEPSFYDEDILNTNYVIDANVVVNMPQTNRTWKVFLWRPLPK